MDEFERDAERESIYRQMPSVERLVVPTLPDFAYAETPVVLAESGSFELSLHHYNTVVVLYQKGSRYEHMDHIIVIDDEQFDEPHYIFPEPLDPPNPKIDMPKKKFFEINSSFYSLVRSLCQMDYSVMSPPETPMPEVFERYDRFLRSDEPIDTVLWRIIDESTGKTDNA